MKVLVSGSSGLIGSALVPGLRARGHQVLRLVRRASKAPDEVVWDPLDKQVHLASLEGIDAVVNLSGAGIADKRWTEARKKILRDSRINVTNTLVEALAVAGVRPKVFVNASAVGFYGDRGSEVLTEDSGGGTGFLANLCGDWERAAFSASSFGARVVCLRIGMVLSSRGGVLARLVPLFKYNLGGPLGDGSAWMSWISCEDLVRMIAQCLVDERLTGPVNAVAPKPIQNADFTAYLAAALGRHAFLRAPAWGLRAALGEMADPLLLASARVMPARMGGVGFEYCDADLPDTLADCLQGIAERRGLAGGA